MCIVFWKKKKILEKRNSNQDEPRNLSPLLLYCLESNELQHFTFV